MGLEIILSIEASLAMLEMGNLVASLLVETCRAMEVLVVASQRLSRAMELLGSKYVLLWWSSLLVETCGAMEVLVVASQRLSLAMELLGSEYVFLWWS